MAPRKPRLARRRNAKATTTTRIEEEPGVNTEERQSENVEPEPTEEESPKEPSQDSVARKHTTPGGRTGRSRGLSKRVKLIQNAEGIGERLKTFPADVVTNLRFMFINLYVEKYKTDRGAGPEEE